VKNKKGFFLMIKQVSMTVASITLLAACSGFQAAEPEIYTKGDETTTATHDLNGPSKTMSGKHYHAGMGEHTHDYADASHTHAHVNEVKMEKVNVANDMSYVNFSFDSASLSSEARAQLATIADKIREAGATDVIVEGHCDERGTREYNLALGDRRAVAVKKYLVGLGVPSKNLTTISYGKERPINPAHNEEAWAENRRAVVNFDK
jgi:peptidoglycan-associated lipoprotein